MASANEVSGMPEAAAPPLPSLSCASWNQTCAKARRVDKHFTHMLLRFRGGSLLGPLSTDLGKHHLCRARAHAHRLTGGVACPQGQVIATAVSTLTTETSAHAAKLKELRKQKVGNSAEADELRALLADAEEEIAVLRLQAERAALLEVQTALAAQLVEDLQVCLPGSLLAAGHIGRA